MRFDHRLAPATSGDTAVSVAAEVTLNDVVASEPKLTAIGPLKPRPVTVTDVAPRSNPRTG